MRSFNLSCNLSATGACTNNLEPAQHTSPWLNQIESTRPSTAASRSASSNTIKADFPPNSKVSFLPWPAVANRIAAPTAVDPVKATLSTPSWAARVAPVSPAPLIIFTTPFGTPDSWQICANSMAVKGVCSAGLITMVLPIAMAGATFHDSINKGKFHGIICAATPTGPWFGKVSSCSFAHPAWWYRWRIAKGISASLLSRMGLPLSKVSSTAAKRAYFCKLRAKA